MYSNLAANMLSAPTVDPTQPANLGLVAPTVDPTQAYDARAIAAKRLADDAPPTAGSTALDNRSFQLGFRAVAAAERPVPPGFFDRLFALAPVLGIPYSIINAIRDKAHNKTLKEAVAMVRDQTKFGAQTSLIDAATKQMTGLEGALARAGFSPSTYEGKGGLGEDSWGPDTDVLLLPKPPGGGLATLPQSPSNVPPSANNTQQVPLPGAPGFSVTIGNPLVPTIFPLS